MITRKEIENKAFWCDEIFVEEPVIRLSDVNKIYNSIGACKKCKYINTENFSWIGYCENLEQDVNPDFYCGNFKPKD